MKDTTISLRNKSLKVHLTIYFIKEHFLGNERQMARFGPRVQPGPARAQRRVAKPTSRRLRMEGALRRRNEP